MRPDYLWFARYDGVATVSDPSIPDTYWPYRRIKQYSGRALETYGGQSLNIDRDQFDLRPVSWFVPFGDFDSGGWSDLIARENSSGKLYLYP